MKGGVHGSDIEMIHIDGRTEIGAVKDAMSRMVNEYKVVACIGIWEIPDEDQGKEPGPIRA